MDKITRIHLAKVPYEIGISAQEKLEKYLSAIRHKLDKDLADEIMIDIEVRVTEILQDRNVKKDGVITLEDIEAIEEQIGSPEQFTDAELGTETVTHSDTHKKLLRNTESAYLGGVSGGLAAYFGIDVVLIRIAFILLTFVSGLGILIYILLWVLVPPAKTSSDMLLMRGEPATAAAIQRYRSATSERSAVKFRYLVKCVFKVFRVLFSVWAALFVLGLLSAVGFLTAILYTQPLRQPYLGYHLNFLLLGLIWLFIVGLVGIIIIVLLRLWRQRSTSLKVAFVSLASLLVLTLAGGAVVSPFIVNHYKNQYSADKIAVALPITNQNTTVAAQTLNIQSDNNLSINYVVTSQPIHATYQAYPGMGHPNVTIVNNNGAITVTTKQLKQVTPNCLLDWCQNIYLPVKMTLYGPSLQNYNANGGAELDLNNLVQKNLSLNVWNGSSIFINNSYSNNFTLTAQSGGSINASDTSAQQETISVKDQNSYIFGPATSSLIATLPDTCNSSVLELDQAPTSLVLNGQTTTVVNSLNQNNCVMLDNLSPDVNQKVLRNHEFAPVPQEPAINQ